MEILTYIVSGLSGFTICFILFTRLSQIVRHLKQIEEYLKQMNYRSSNKW